MAPAASDTEAQRGGPSRVHYALLFCILLLSLTLRMVDLASLGSNGDEQNVALGTSRLLEAPAGEFSVPDLDERRSLSNVVQNCIYNDSGNTIFYYLVLTAWNSAFGASDFALRTFSVLASLGAITVTYLLLSRLPLRRPQHVALGSCLLLGLNPTLLDASQTSRTYPLAVLMALLCTMLLLDWLKDGGHLRLVAYGTVSGLLLLTHYLAVTVLVAHLLFTVAIWSERSRSRLLKFLLIPVPLALVILFAWYANGGNAGLKNMVERNRLIAETQDIGYRYWMAEANPKNLLTSSYQVVNSNLGLYSLQGLGFRVRTAAPLLLVLVGLVMIGSVCCLRCQEAGRATWLLPLLAFTHFPFAFVLALRSGHVTSLLSNYFLWTVPFWLALGVLGASELGARFPKVALTLKGVVLIWAALMLWQILGISGDVSPKYPTGRQENPFETLAHRIEAPENEIKRVRFRTQRDALLTAIQLDERSDVLLEIRLDQEGDVQLESQDGTVEEFSFEGLRY